MNTEPISYDESIELLLAHCNPIEREELVPIAQAWGRVLSQNVVAPMPTPRYNRAAMDGYAVRASDTKGALPGHPIRLLRTGTVFPNTSPSTPILPTECMRLCTGSILPPGADSVVMAEDTVSEGQYVLIKKGVSPGNFVSLRGSDIQEGELILKTETILNPSKIGALASQGKTEARVYAKPVVAVISTGDEIVKVGTDLKEGEIYDINSSALYALISENGGIPYQLPIAKDTLPSLKQALNQALIADMVVISGGSSVGEKDLLQDVLASMGRVVFHGIRIKPGQPTAFSLIDGKPVLNMPGPPTACLMNAYLLVVPALRKLARLPAEGHTIRAKMNCETKASPTTKSFPVILQGETATPAFRKSGDILPIAKANGYVVIAENAELPRDGVLVTMF